MKKYVGFAAAVGVIVVGGLVGKYLDVTAGGALVAAGAWFVGKLQREWFPHQKDDAP